MSDTPRWLKEQACDRAEGVCEAMCSPHCGWKGTDVHHRKKRSQGGPHTLENALFVCRACHAHIESHPAWSYERGLLIHGWAPIEWPPVFFRGVSYELAGVAGGVEAGESGEADLWGEFSAD